MLLMLSGWEMDESIEVGAHRETFEEAGVLGVLGPKLTDVEYETRKGKKRRLELESLAKLKHGMLLRSGSSFESSRSSSFMSVEEPNNSTNDTEPVSNLMDESRKGGEFHSTHSSRNLQEDFEPSSISENSKSFMGDKKQNSQHVVNDSTSSSPLLAADSTKSCTFVRMCMFIMYVSEVREEWPESGRARKFVDIDEAIEAMSGRAEFQTVLLEVKRNGFHLNIPPQEDVKSNSLNVNQV